MALFTVNFTHLHYNKIQRVFCSFSPKLPRIHIGIHCNANNANNNNNNNNDDDDDDDDDDDNEKSKP